MGRFDRKDFGWISTLFGTAVGAGILYLPVNAAKAGFYLLLIVTILVIPAIWMAHRNLTRFCLSSSKISSNITSTFSERFGLTAGFFLVIAYFICIFPIALLYGIGLTNVVNDLFIKFFHLSPPPRFITSFVLLALMVLIISKGEKWVLTATEFLVIPLAIILVSCAIYFIPIWKKPVSVPVNWIDILKTATIVAPLLVFSFNHSPAISAFAQTYRSKYRKKTDCDKKTSRILLANISLLAIVIVPFVFSCVLSMSASDLHNAVDKNIPALIAISASNYISWMPFVISAITILAITSSFFGVYIGSLEGASGLIYFISRHMLKNTEFKITKQIGRLINLTIFLICWIVASYNYSVINIILNIVAPVLAILLFIMPVISLYIINDLKSYRSPLADLYTFFVGCLVVAGFIVSIAG